MKIKVLVSLLTIACLLVVAISPLVARNTPYPEKLKGDCSAHPWQDDNQVSENEPIQLISVPIGPIIITISVPQSWVNPGAKSKPASVKPTSKVKSSKPMSLDQKGEIR